MRGTLWTTLAVVGIGGSDRGTAFTALERDRYMLNGISLEEQRQRQTLQQAVCG
jgi:hypothetical protein